MGLIKEYDISSNLRDALVFTAGVLLDKYSIILKVFCQKDGTELMRNIEERYYKCSKCGNIWNWNGGN